MRIIKKILLIAIILMLLLSTACEVSIESSSSSSSNDSQVTDDMTDKMWNLIIKLAEDHYSRQYIIDEMVDRGYPAEDAEELISCCGYKWEDCASGAINIAYKEGEILTVEQAEIFLKNRKFTEGQIAYAIEQNPFIPTAEEYKAKIASQGGGSDTQTGKSDNAYAEAESVAPAQKKNKYNLSEYIVGTWIGEIERLGVEVEDDFEKFDNATVSITFKDGRAILAGLSENFSVDYDLYGEGTYTVDGNNVTYSIPVRYCNYDRETDVTQQCTLTLSLADDGSLKAETSGSLTKKSDEIETLSLGSTTETRYHDAVNISIEMPKLPVRMTNYDQVIYDNSSHYMETTIDVISINVDNIYKLVSHKDDSWYVKATVELSANCQLVEGTHTFVSEQWGDEVTEYNNIIYPGFAIYDEDGYEVYRGWFINGSTNFEIKDAHGTYTLKLLSITKDGYTADYKQNIIYH